MDLAKGHVALLKNIEHNSGINFFNFGTGKALSVLQIVNAFEKILSVSIPLKFVKRREGDIQASYCNPNKSKKRLGWTSKHNLEQSIKDIAYTLKK